MREVRDFMRLPDRPLSVRELCSEEVKEARPYYWLEESALLYTKVDALTKKLQAAERILGPEMDALVDTDNDLFGLWQSFEKDAATAVERISDSSLQPVVLPSFFGYPESGYYFNGILLFETRKNHVSLSHAKALLRFGGRKRGRRAR